MIRDYACRPEASDQGIAGLIREYDLPVPEIYKKREQMIKAAVLEREKRKKPFCTLPFDHTLEAENMGGSIRYGNEKAGPRAAAPVCSSLEELSFLSRMDPESGRMAETLAACRMLREQGEEVVFQMSGPYTIWNTLIELKQVFKAARKTPEQVEALFQKLEEDLLGLLLEVKKNGVRMVSYADSAGGLSILGPRMLEWTTDVFTAPFLRKAEHILGQEMVMILCPKTACALEDTGSAVREEIALPEEMTYQKACIYAAGKARFPAQMCINGGRSVLKSKTLQVIRLCRNEIEE